MTRHQKRLSAPESWPVERKTSVFTVGPNPGPHDSHAVPLVVFLRDVLGYVENKKEARYVLEKGRVLINGEDVSDHRRAVGTFDIVSIPSRDEYYRVFPGEGGTLSLTPVEPDAATDKLARIDDKTDIGDGEVQLNLHNGSNIVVDDDEYSTLDSIVISLDDAEVVHHFEFEPGKAVTVVEGRHSGEVGEIVERSANEGSNPNTVVIQRGDGSEFETLEKYVFVIGEELESLEEQEEDN